MAQLVLRPFQSQLQLTRKANKTIQVPTCAARPSSPGTCSTSVFGHGAAWPSPSARRVVVRSAKQDPPSTPPASSPTPSAPDNSQLLFSIGITALWIGLSVYGFLLSPNQTPYRDQIFIERIIGIGEQDGFVVNPVFVSLFSIMGIYPAIYAALLVPAGRSENKVPAWPFVTLSFAFGAFALLPYMALWRPYRRPEDNPLPPPPSELEGWNRLFLKGAETPVMPALLLAGSVYYIFQAVTSSGDVWLDYLKLFDESRLVHVSSVDFATLTALAPFWMDNDATGRNWDKRSQLLPILSVLPVIGPCIYLLLRPKAQQPQ
ncbi:hypothetical protein PLESTB_000791900 [Pleodorina starrii]|uniref:DUF2834 domain-containing protein n=1 Tax=Pleodorina starrii TaxID=330485 RepID=A0A9W6BLA3_9CHLO|nr:hypothetical protein PLESTM_001006100 [Pleodorina starrii]GLC53830.1 hypothetical protein PLESTB_000791900 [Pleodorina starrii]GLC73010.1 hypothetical protein PLESTF_001319500 [Pleodorina starrii]